LRLAGLKAPSAATLAALAKCKAWDGRLPEVTELSADGAEALAAYEGQHLWLDGLVEVSADVATALAKCRVEVLRLHGLQTLPADAARGLAAFKGQSLLLNSVATLSPEAAEAIAAFQGDRLDLNLLKTLSPEAARSLAGFAGGELWLNNLTTLEPEVVTALTAFKGDNLVLSTFCHRLGNGIPLDADAARLVCTCARGNSLVSLWQLSALETADAVEIATILATARGRLAIPNLKRISPKTLTALVTKEDIEIPLIEKLELIREPDGSPTEDFAIPEGFLEFQKRQRR
jgi:hypothetical protein